MGFSPRPKRDFSRPRLKNRAARRRGPDIISGSRADRSPTRTHCSRTPAPILLPTLCQDDFRGEKASRKGLGLTTPRRDFDSPRRYIYILIGFDGGRLSILYSNRGIVIWWRGCFNIVRGARSRWYGYCFRGVRPSAGLIAEFLRRTIRRDSLSPWSGELLPESLEVADWNFFRFSFLFSPEILLPEWINFLENSDSYFPTGE